MLINAAKFYVNLFVFVVCCGCSSKINVSGCYNSNYPELGMFGHHIELKPDSSFTFRFAGDLISREGKGIYHIKRDTIFLIFNKNIKRDTLSEIGSDAIITQDTRLFYENNRLYFIDKATNKVIRGTESVHINHKKYLFFGDHYIKKRFYLEKRLCKST